MSLLSKLIKKKTVTNNSSTRTQTIHIDPVPWSLPEDFLHFIINKFLEEIETGLPQLHRIKPLIIRFMIPNTDIICALKIESNGEDPNERSLWTVASKKDSDVAYNNLITRGSTDDVKAYLMDDKNFSEIYNSIHELSDSVNEG